MRTPLISALVVLAAAACGSADGDGAWPAGEWIAVSGVSEGSAVELVEGFPVTVGLDGDRIEGVAACNGYSGTAELGDDGTFSAGDLSWTEIGCEPAVMGVEQAYLMSLGGFTEYFVGDGFLTLRSDVDEWVFAQLAGSASGNSG